MISGKVCLKIGFNMLLFLKSKIKATDLIHTFFLFRKLYFSNKTLQTQHYTHSHTLPELCLPYNHWDKSNIQINKDPINEYLKLHHIRIISKRERGYPLIGKLCHFHFTVSTRFTNLQKLTYFSNLFINLASFQ